MVDSESPRPELLPNPSARQTADHQRPSRGTHCDGFVVLIESLEDLEAGVCQMASQARGASMSGSWLAGFENLAMADGR